MFNPYTIRIFMPDGEPDKFKIIDKQNWTGVGLEVSRDTWQKYRNRDEFERAGIYILAGYQEDDDLPTIYIGQGDGVKGRIDSHEKLKEFWDRVLVFVTSNLSLNRAHITWLEWALINKANEAARCKVENSVTPNEPVLSESEKASINEFLNEILTILPLVELRVFEKAKKIEAESNSTRTSTNSLDTIVVPAQEEGFNRVFLGENCWYAIRIGGGMIKKIKYIAAYQTKPISAVTHYAEVKSIEPYGDGDKYKLDFSGPAKKMGPIPFGNFSSGSMQGSRYTTHEKLFNAKTLVDLF